MDFRRIVLASVLMCASGCALVTRLPAEPGEKTADGEEIVETVQVMNSSWSLLCLLPIASAYCSADTCPNFENQIRMIEAEAKKCGASRARHVVTYEDVEDVFLVLLLRRKMHTSATLVR